MIQAPKGDLTASIRELGRTRIEVVPRDSRSVFVHWEVANAAPDSPTAPPPLQLRIDLVREADDVIERSFETSKRVSSEIAEVSPNHRYYAVLNLIAPQKARLARSSTIARTSHEAEGFVVVEPGQHGLTVSKTESPTDAPVDWSWEGTGSSPK